jgi:flagellin-like hook-associated protein FlgL
MVSAVTPGPSALGPNAVAPNAGAADPRAREKAGAAGAPPAASPADTIAQPAHWRAARESVRQALADLDLSLAAGREAAELVARISDAARAQDKAGVRDLLASLDDLVEGAIKAGAAALSGAAVRAQIAPEAPAFEVEGFDLRLKHETGAGVRLTRASNAATPEHAAAAFAAAQETLARLEAALARLSAAAARLQAHEGFLAALETGVSAQLKNDIDADAARLLALNVRQGLSESDAAIANAQSDSVLALFRS